MPSRTWSAAHLMCAGALGGGLYGAGESLRVLGSARLFQSDAETALLVAVATLGPAAVGASAATFLAVLPLRPLGRQRWSGFLVGLVTVALLDLGIYWFSDPPPFQAPRPLQGNLPAFLGVIVAAGVACLGVYQVVRGAQRVSATILGLVLGMGIWGAVSRSSPAAPTEAMPAGAPNVLLVTLDTTRADRIGAYGHTIDTPAFDRLAAEGALFLDASAVAAVTGPSHTSMLSGSGPWDHGVLLNGIPVPNDRTLLAEVLHDRGWATGGFVSSYVLDGDKGFRRGFDVYDDDFGWLPGAQDMVLSRALAMMGRFLNPEEDLERRGGQTVDRALAWMGAQQGAYFAWVHLFDPHGPYEAPPPFDTRYYQGDPRDPAHSSMKDVKNVAAYLKKSLEGITDVNYVLASYDGEISYADAQLGRLLEGVDAKNTLVVVIADHGELLGEHDIWFNHGDDVYEASLHVPFAMRWPGRIESGVRVEQPFEGTDLTPTILELVGVPTTPNMTGVSVAGLVGDYEGKGRLEARSLCFDREANVAARERGEITGPKFRMAGLRGPRSRYVEREIGRPPEFFDLATDPKGVKDVYPNVVCSTEGKQLLDVLHSTTLTLFASDATARSSADVGEAERQRLEALGYLDGTDAEGEGGAAVLAPLSVPCPTQAP